MDYTANLNEMIEAIIEDGTQNTTGSMFFYLDELADEFDIDYDKLLSIKDEVMELLNEQVEISKVNFEPEDDYSSASFIIYLNEEYCDCLSTEDLSVEDE